ncbi:MAG: hypothetical protein WCI71_09980 [Bacteroidota bacterium]
MKATTIIIAAVLTLSVNVLFAGTNNESTPAANNNTEMILTALAPSLPSVATFEDVVLVNDFAFLAPFTPDEATFEDVSDVLMLNDLAPVTPLEADFNDGEVGQTIDISTLAPVMPKVADFE